MKTQQTKTEAAYDPTDSRNRNSQTSEQFEREMRNDSIAKIGSPEWRKAPAQAQHSPLPRDWQSDFKVANDAARAYSEKLTDMTFQCDEALAHAQRLADALAKMLKLNIVPSIKNVGAAIEARGEKHNGLATVMEAEEALAQWEGSK